MSIRRSVACNQPFVLVVRANPDPNQVLIVYDRQRPVGVIYAG
jgi:hypothetical protein